jgi:sodium-independent sulfate anion transporter 11
MASPTKIGHGLAKVLGINLHYRNETGSDRITRGESVFSVGTADTYVEEEPTAAEWLRSITPSLQDVKQYIIRLFPFLHWITRYNAQWLIGDLVAGSLPCHLYLRKL